MISSRISCLKNYNFPPAKNSPLILQNQEQGQTGEKLCSSNTVQPDHCTRGQKCRVLFLFWLIPLILTLLRTRNSWSINTSLHKTLYHSNEKQNKSCLRFISHSSPWSWRSLCNPSTAKYLHFTGGGTESNIQTGLNAIPFLVFWRALNQWQKCRVLSKNNV